MRRTLALVALGALMALSIIPASAATQPGFAMTGEGRALELAIAGEGVTLGLSYVQADSTPSVIGVGAGQCELVGEITDTDSLPCSEDNTVKSEYPGAEGDNTEKCDAALPAPIDQLVQLDLVCGSSHSTWKNGSPASENEGQVGKLSTENPFDSEVLADILPTDPGDAADVVDDLTDALDPILSQLPAEVKTALDNILAVVTGVGDVKAVELQLGPSSTTITPNGQTITVDATGAAARLGLVGLPVVDAAGAKIDDADPLTNGLVIVEIGPSQASATIDKGDASASAAASASLVTVKVRDITQPTLTYVEIPVGPGDTVTVLEGTPLESTITAADTIVEEGDGTAQAAADAVRLDLLKGVNGGIQLGLSRTAAAVSVTPAEVKDKQEDPPEILPVTGGSLPYAGIGILLLLTAAGVLVIRRRVVG